MRACIHRGSDQIGGNLIELESDGDRLVLDAGLPLDLSGVSQRELLPDVPGLWSEGDGSLKGAVITHSHADHHGLADLIDPGIPIAMGKAASDVLEQASFFVPGVNDFHVDHYLEHQVALQLGSFTVTPWLVDHSAYDSYALLVEAGGKRLLYTGDVRTHGRKSSSLMDLANKVGAIDSLIMEGTRVRAGDDGRSTLSERDVEDAVAEEMSETDGMMLLFYSPQNIDRMVSLYRAATRSNRVFVMDLYAASTAAATGNRNIPQASWDGVRVFVPNTQRRRVIEESAFHRVEKLHKQRIYPNELKLRCSEISMICRSSMSYELERFQCLDGASAIWSMWSGYLGRNGVPFQFGESSRSEVPIKLIHASGHASSDDLRQFATAIGPGQIVPIHTEHSELFRDMFGVGATIRNDGRWWSV